MTSVGLRELKNRLSAYIRRVRAGEAILVTDRGQVVAELRPSGQVSLAGRTDELALLTRQGMLSLGAPNDASLYPALPRLLRSTTSRQLLEVERGAR